MIPNLSLKFQKLLWISLTVVFCLDSTGSYSQVINEIHKNELDIIDQSNLPITLQGDSIYIGVIKNNKSCLNCFYVINAYLNTLTNNRKIILIAIAHAQNSSLVRKRNIYELKQQFPDFNLFGITEDQRWNDKTITPEIFIYNKGKMQFYTYEEIFANGFQMVSFKVQSEIESLLNEK